MSSCATCVVRVDPTSSEYQKKMEKVVRNLALLSQSAAYYSLQVKNGYHQALDEGIPEMQELLTGARNTGE